MHGVSRRERRQTIDAEEAQSEQAQGEARRRHSLGKDHALMSILQVGNFHIQKGAVSLWTHHRYIPETGCMEWTGHRDKAGYGRIHWGERGGTVRVHRLAAYLYLGHPLDSPLNVLHRCDNPPCFATKHLFIGTAADNSADKIAKGRWDGPKPWTHCRRGHVLVLMPNATPTHGHRSRRYCPACQHMRRRGEI